MKTFVLAFHLIIIYIFFTVVSKTLSLYVYHTDIKSGTKVPDDSFITVLKLICSKINLFSYPHRTF